MDRDVEVFYDNWYRNRLLLKGDPNPPRYQDLDWRHKKVWKEIREDVNKIARLPLFPPPPGHKP